MADGWRQTDDKIKDRMRKHFRGRGGEGRGESRALFVHNGPRWAAAAGE